MRRGASWSWIIGFAALSCTQSVEFSGQETGCLDCHRPIGTLGQEVAHEDVALRCVDCHGGDPNATNQDEAHVSGPELGALSAQEMLEADPDYLRFVSPTNPRTAQQSCGGGSDLSSSFVGCHQEIVTRSRISMHGTMAGILNISRFDVGAQAGRPAETSVTDVDNEVFVASTAPRFTYASQAGLQVPDISGLGPDDGTTYMDFAITQACTGCHLGVAGGTLKGNEGRFRGAGCAACHIPYTDDGVTVTEDPTITSPRPGRAAQHDLVDDGINAACERCHWHSSRIALTFKGLVSEDAEPSDATPPDVHQESGMGCIDCHLDEDVHGDGHLRPNMGAATTIECTDCHGTYEAEIVENDEGTFMTAAGTRLTNISRTDGGGIVLLGADGAERQVPQIKILTELPTAGRDLRSAHSFEDHGELECYACHTAWMPNFYLIDVELNLDEDAKSPLDGQVRPGAVTETDAIVTTGDLILGINVDQKIGPFMAQTRALTVTRTGTTTIERFIGRSSEGRLGLSFVPVYPHTTGRAERTQPCSRCHVLAGDSNLAEVRAVYGFGSGAHTLMRGGVTYDLTRMVDDTGTSTVSLGTLLARPIEPERVRRILELASD